MGEPESSSAPNAAEVEALNREALLELEWPALLDLVASYCSNGVAAERLRQLLPTRDLDLARHRMALSAESMRLLEAEKPLPKNDVHDIAPALADLEGGRLLGVEQLGEVKQCLEAAQELRRFFTKAEEEVPLVRAHLTASPLLTPPLETLRRCLTPDGEISDAASKDLASARRSVVDRRRSLRRILDQCLSRYAKALQGSYFAERDGRFVLPVRSDAGDRPDGLLLGASGSGQTLYIAPRETLAASNELVEAESAVLREEARVLRELCSVLKPRLAELHEAFEICVRVNQLRAIADFANDFGAHPIEFSGEPKLELIAARHPLLVEQARCADASQRDIEVTVRPANSVAAEHDVIANDIRARSGQALMISGPNAGGKTVAMKCLGLSVLMARAGLPVLAEAASSLGFYPNVFANIGDHQSIMHSLSSFTSHIDNVKRFLMACDDETLVLIDEMAGGTDPLEGAALARALLGAFCERGPAVVITTHYEQLKELGTNDDARFVNASVGFDLDSLKPTFHLTLGSPGVSSALLVAQTRGVPTGVVEEAKRLMPETVRLQREMLSQLEHERRLQHEARVAAERHEREQRKILADLEARRARFANEERERLAREARELTQEVRQARGQLQHAKQQLKQQLDERKLRDAERSLSEAAQSVSIGGKLSQVVRATQRPPTEVTRAPEAHELASGTRAHYQKLGVDVEVAGAPQRGRVRIIAGAMRMEVPIGELTIRATPSSSTRSSKGASGGKSSKVSNAHRQSPANEFASDTASSDGPNESTTAPSISGASPIRMEHTTCDLRGQRVDEALDLVDGLIDRLLQSGEPGGFVLHGHGTGALKKAVREHLAQHACIGKSAPAEREDGGDAFTVFWLRG